MKAAPFNLFFVDRATRFKMYSVSSLVGIALGWTSLLFGSSARDSLIGSMIVAFMIIASWTYVYCSQFARVQVSAQ